ncbi:MAG: universal stress protein, partial [Nocardioidaceae bacterium]
LRVYLGAAPGVGKTYAMLGEGQRRMSRGTDIVVGYVETYGRPLTGEMIKGLEVVPRRLLSYRGGWFEEMDTDAIVDRHPAVVLVDELAHANVPGSRRAKRWEDVLDILAACIDVVTTINVQHLESLNDVVRDITSIRQQETVPDWVVDLADQVELVDMSPEALRRRMRHGNVYPDPAKAELALRRFFTLEHLTALRELALMRVADRVDSDLLQRWSKASTPETRERILVCVSGSDLSDTLVRRGARMAHRVRGDLLVLHVRTGDDRFDPETQTRIEELTCDLGGELHVVDADSVVDGILGFVRRQRVTQCVVGEPLRPAWQELLTGSVVSRLIRKASQVDVHVIARRER